MLILSKHQTENNFKSLAFVEKCIVQKGPLHFPLEDAESVTPLRYAVFAEILRVKFI